MDNTSFPPIILRCLAIIVDLFRILIRKEAAEDGAWPSPRRISTWNNQLWCQFESLTNRWRKSYQNRTKLRNKRFISFTSAIGSIFTSRFQSTSTGFWTSSKFSSQSSFFPLSASSFSFNKMEWKSMGQAPSMLASSTLLRFFSPTSL